MTIRPRVLLLAETASPERVSVPLVAWCHSQALARRADVHLVAQVRDRPAILRAGLVEGRDFTAIDSEAVARRVQRLANLLRGGTGKGWTTLTALSTLAYYYFERLVWQQFGERIRAGEFDLVHRLAPLSPTMPSLLAGKCRRAGVPFVLGPLNGGLPWPKGFDAERRKEREWLSYVRGAYKLLPGYRSTRESASAMLIASEATWEQVPARYRCKCFYVPENGIDVARFPEGRRRQATLPIEAVFVGRLVPYKGADMLIEAAAPLVRSGRLRVKIVGDGPERPRLEAMRMREQVEDGVTLTGWVDHGAIQTHLREADVLAFPSIREFGGGVVLEAMAVGVVPIVVDYGGPGELATAQTGYLVPVGKRAQIVADFRAVLSRVCADPSELAAKSSLAMCRARTQFSWDAKAGQVMEVYRWLLEEGICKPVFPMPMPDPPVTECAAADR